MAHHLPKNSYKNPQTTLCTSSLHRPNLYIFYLLDKRLMHVKKMLWILLPCLSTLVSLYTCQIRTAVSTKTWLSWFCGNQSYYDSKPNCRPGQISLWKSASSSDLILNTNSTNVGWGALCGKASTGGFQRGSPPNLEIKAVPLVLKFLRKGFYCKPHPCTVW